MVNMNEPNDATPWMQGYVARVADRHRKDDEPAGKCPFKEGSPQAREWAKGYRDNEDDFRNGRTLG
jgi:hypothetical protein